MNESYNTELVDKAINYAVLYHKNTRRKGKNIPYVVHPLEAMSIVATITEDNELLAAACLHDLIEDTDVTYEDIKKEFGKRIADIVYEESVNEIPNYENLSWLEVKKIALDNLKKASIDVKIVALADKLSNIRAINLDFKKRGMELWKIFKVKDPQIHKWRYTELTKCFNELEYTDAFKEFKKLVDETFKGI